MKIGSLFYKAIDVASNNTVRNLMTSFGVGLVSGAAIYTLITTFVNTAITNLQNMPYLSIMGLFGIDAALSIYLGALLTKASIDALTMSIRKK